MFVQGAVMPFWRDSITLFKKVIVTSWIAVFTASMPSPA
jgi:hypothetical protein